MNRSAKALLIVVSLACTGMAQRSQTARPPQPQTATTTATDDKASIYYHFAMGRLYAELGQAEGSKETINKAIQHYQDALKLDPSNGIIFEELTDLYIQTGQLQSAVTQAEDLLKQNPDNLEARRMLGRIYTRMIGNVQTGKINDNFLRQAIDQYQKITQKAPEDTESWVLLGRLYGVSHNSPEAEKAFNTALKLDPANEDALTGIAQLYIDLGDTKAAVAKLKAVTDKNPTEATLAALAKAYEDLQLYKDAADALKRALAISQDDGRLAHELAEDLLRSDQVDEALPLFQQLATDEPRNPEYALKLAEIYLVKRDLPKARQALNRAKQADPANLSVRYNEARLLEAEGHPDQAITVLKGALEETTRKTYSEGEKKNRVIFLEKLGIDYRATEQYPQAIEIFRQIAALDPEAGSEAAVQVIETYRAQKDFASAQREAEAASKKFPKDRAVTVERASVLADQGKVDEAAAEVRTLLDGKQDRAVQLELAQIYEKGKRWNDMAKVLDEAEKLSAGNEDKETVYFMRGAMLERQKKFDEAEAQFRKVLAINPNNASTLNYYGYMLADRNVRLDEASQMIQKALELDPDNGAFLDSLGWAYYRQGKLPEAEELLIRAIQKQPDPTVRDHLGDVYLKLGKTKDAIAQWQASLKDFQKTAADNDPEEVAKVHKKLDDAQARLARESHKE